MCMKIYSLVFKYVLYIDNQMFILISLKLLTFTMQKNG